MKKFLNIFLVMAISLIVTEPIFAGLSTTMPEKFKQKNFEKRPYQTVPEKKNNEVRKTVPSSQNSVSIQKTTTPTKTISQAEKEKYYENYEKYLEQTIKSVCGFTEEDVYNSCIQGVINFDENGKLKDVTIYSNSNNTQKCKMCENKLFLANLKQYDKKYAPSSYADNKVAVFHIKLKSEKLQKEKMQTILKDLISNYWTPENSSSNCIMKITITIKKRYNYQNVYFIKSYETINSSGNNDYNSMVQVAIKRLVNYVNETKKGPEIYDFFPIMGDMTLIYKFEGNQITAIDSIADVNKQNSYTNGNNTETGEQSVNKYNTIETITNSNRNEVKNSGQDINKSNNKENLLQYINNKKEALTMLYSYEKSGKYKINIPKDDYYKVTLVGGGGTGNKKKNYGPVGVSSGYNSYAHASGGSGASFYGDIYLTKGNHVVKVGDVNQPTLIDDIIIAGAGGKAKFNSYNGDYAPFGGIGGSVIINSTKIKNYYLVKGNTGLTKQVIGSDLVQGASSSYDSRINGYGAGGSSDGNAFSGYCKIEKILPLNINLNELKTQKTSTSNQTNSNLKYNIMNDNEIIPISIP